MGFINFKNILSNVPLVIFATFVMSIIMTYFILPILYVRKLENLDDCSCVNDWRKNFLKYGGIIVAITIISGLILYPTNSKIKRIIILVLFMVYEIISLTYLTDLKNCQCAMEGGGGMRTFLYAVLMIMVIVRALLVILFMGSMLK
jgi:hypothetical protein